uniref:Uncharacterized protein n=1 Tax=Panagrolaimus davidi TaxID=227884 RepID=A0A914Q7M0_9BILA
MKVMDVDEGIDLEATLETTNLLKNECEECKKLEKRLEMIEEKMKNSQRSLDQFNKYRIKYETELDDIRASYELKDDECQQLLHQIDAYLNCPQIASKLPPIAQIHIQNLGEQLRNLEYENTYMHGECIKQRDMREFEAERCKTIESEGKLLMARAEDQESAYKSLRKNFEQKLIELHEDDKQKAEEIKDLENDVSRSIQLFTNILNSPEFGNNEIKQEIQKFLDSEFNVNENL